MRRTKNAKNWKRSDRLDSVMNVLLIVLALSVLGIGAYEAERNAGMVSSAQPERA